MDTNEADAPSGGGRARRSSDSSEGSEYNPDAGSGSDARSMGSSDEDGATSASGGEEGEGECEGEGEGGSGSGSGSGSEVGALVPIDPSALFNASGSTGSSEDADDSGGFDGGRPMSTRSLRNARGNDNDDDDDSGDTLGDEEDEEDEEDEDVGGHGGESTAGGGARRTALPPTQPAWLPREMRSGGELKALRRGILCLAGAISHDARLTCIDGDTLAPIHAMGVTPPSQGALGRASPCTHLVARALGLDRIALGLTASGRETVIFPRRAAAAPLDCALMVTLQRVYVSGAKVLRGKVRSTKGPPAPVIPMLAPREASAAIENVRWRHPRKGDDPRRIVLVAWSILDVVPLPAPLRAANVIDKAVHVMLDATAGTPGAPSARAASAVADHVNTLALRSPARTLPLAALFGHPAVARAAAIQAPNMPPPVGVRDKAAAVVASFAGWAWALRAAGRVWVAEIPDAGKHPYTLGIPPELLVLVSAEVRAAVERARTANAPLPVLAFGLTAEELSLGWLNPLDLRALEDPATPDAARTAHAYLVDGRLARAMGLVLGDGVCGAAPGSAEEARGAAGMIEAEALEAVREENANARVTGIATATANEGGGGGSIGTELALLAARGVLRARPSARRSNQIVYSPCTHVEVPRRLAALVSKGAPRPPPLPDAADRVRGATQGTRMRAALAECVRRLATPSAPPIGIVEAPARGGKTIAALAIAARFLLGEVVVLCATPAAAAAATRGAHAPMTTKGDRAHVAWVPTLAPADVDVLVAAANGETRGWPRCLAGREITIHTARKLLATIHTIVVDDAAGVAVGSLLRVIHAIRRHARANGAPCAAIHIVGMCNPHYAGQFTAIAACSPPRRLAASDGPPVATTSVMEVLLALPHTSRLVAHHRLEAVNRRGARGDAIVAATCGEPAARKGSAGGLHAVAGIRSIAMVRYGVKKEEAAEAPAPLGALATAVAAVTAKELAENGPATNPVAATPPPAEQDAESCARALEGATLALRTGLDSAKSPPWQLRGVVVAISARGEWGAAFPPTPAGIAITSAAVATAAKAGGPPGTAGPGSVVRILCDVAADSLPRDHPFATYSAPRARAGTVGTLQAVVWFGAALGPHETAPDMVYTAGARSKKKRGKRPRRSAPPSGFSERLLIDGRWVACGGESIERLDVVTAAQATGCRLGPGVLVCPEKAPPAAAEVVFWHQIFESLTVLVRR